MLQDACINCHGAELKQANDSHPRSKFTDPRNADRVDILDARICITCHREHKEEITHAMGVTMPDDYCFLCHKDIARERPSHEGLAFTTCTSAGCHNFHDNRALYEDFIGKHLDEPDFKSTMTVLPRRPRLSDKPPLFAATHNAPASQAQPAVLHDWEDTAHAKAGVNCKGCHQPSGAVAWIDKPGHDTCQGCHVAEANGFLAGKHGMRLKQNLSPMTPAMARIPMKPDAADKELGCVSCHSAHRFDTRIAAVEACESCHNDDHTRAFRSSPHFRLWQAELGGAAPPGSGVSCATCHLPRFVDAQAEGRVHAQHNQNDNLRPNEKMARSVCLNCHGLGFTLDALADPAAVASNFATAPGRRVESLEWVKRRLKREREASGKTQ